MHFPRKAKTMDRILRILTARIAFIIPIVFVVASNDPQCSTEKPVVVNSHAARKYTSHISFPSRFSCNEATLSSDLPFEEKKRITIEAMFNIYGEVLGITASELRPLSSSSSSVKGGNSFSRYLKYNYPYLVKYIIVIFTLPM